MEVYLFLLQPVQSPFVFLPQNALFRRKVEKNSKIGHYSPKGGPVHLHYCFHSHSSCRPLVGQTGIHEPVADNDFALFNGGYYFLPHMLASGGGVKQSLCFRRHLPVVHVKYYFPDLLAYGRASRLPGEKDVNAFFIKIIHKKPDLRALARAVGTLYGYKLSPHLKHSLMLYYIILFSG